MKSKSHGQDILEAEIQGISQWGIWLLIGDGEYFLSFDEYPWFQKATVSQIYDVEFHHGKHLHWPALDVDVDVEALKAPQAYPLKYK